MGGFNEKLGRLLEEKKWLFWNKAPPQNREIVRYEELVSKDVLLGTFKKVPKVKGFAGEIFFRTRGVLKMGESFWAPRKKRV